MMILTYHGFFFALAAVVVAYRLSLYQKQMSILTRLSAVESVLVIFLAGLMGAKLAYGVFTQSTHIADYLAFWQIGLISWGGLISGGVAAWLMFNKHPEYSLLKNALILSLLPGWVIGRVGNLLQRDAYGIADPTWAFFYGRVPVVLFEIFGLLIIWIIAQLLWQSNRRRTDLGAYVLIYYALLRLIIDRWREMTSVYWVLNWSQLAALGALICGIIWIWRINRAKAT